MTAFDLQRAATWFKWYAAHTAGFGGLAMALAYICTAQWNEAALAFLSAMAGFGLAVKPRA